MRQRECLGKREEKSKQVSRDNEKNNASRRERKRKRREVVKQSAGTEASLQPRIVAATKGIAKK